MRARHTLTTSIVAAALAACTTTAAPAPGGSAGAAATSSPSTLVRGGSAGTAVLAAARLVPFDSCDDLRDHYVDGARDLVGPFGLGGSWPEPTDAVAGSASEAASADRTTSSTAGEGEAGGFSGTNVQEQGVDEPDVVTTDGEVLVTLVDGGLRVLDAEGAEVVGRLELPAGARGTELLMDGDDLLVLGAGLDLQPRGPADGGLVPAFPATRTTITRVDLADPSSPVLAGSVRLEGEYRSARMVDGTVRVVLESQPTGLSFTGPEDGGLAAEQAAEDENRRRLEASDVDDWVPHLQVTGPDGTAGPVQRVQDCTAIARPDTFAGLATLSVLTLDIADDAMLPTSSAGLVASGETVYASTDRLVVATSPWGSWRQRFTQDRPDPDGGVTTDLHAFDISDPDTTTYVASGSVDGTLLNQFALSEVDGVVRAATTTGLGWWGGGDEESQSQLVVLEEDGGVLAEVGRVDGLGVTERIYAVRYPSPDLAAVVTFRETDPLYLVDTSDPTAPQVTGELKVPGFSTYLHPVGGDRLVGVGQDADEQGRRRGLQTSLFDVADLTAPARVDQLTFGDGHSAAEDDHRAFLHWAPTGQVVLPAELWARPSDGDGPRRPFSGAVVLREVGDRLVRQGRVPLRADDGERWDAVRRSIVVGPHLWLLGTGTATRVDLDDLGGRTEVDLL